MSTGFNKRNITSRLKLLLKLCRWDGMNIEGYNGIFLIHLTDPIDGSFEWNKGMTSRLHQPRRISNIWRISSRTSHAVKHT